MSGVLDRMVQRSRGQLPAIEPLVRAQQTAAAELLFQVEETGAVVPRVQHAPQAERESVLRGKPAGPVRENMRPDVAQANRETPKDSGRSDTHDLARVGGTAESHETSAPKHAPEDGLKRVRQVAQEDAESQSSEKSPEIQAETTGGAAKAEETAAEKIRTDAKPEQRAEMQETLAVRNERREAAAAIDAADAAEHTEIHITIGSVELRAPRVAPVPPKTSAFRPRVTLDEFLKRGSGSGGWGAKS